MCVGVCMRICTKTRPYYYIYLERYKIYKRLARDRRKDVCSLLCKDTEDACALLDRCLEYPSAINGLGCDISHNVPYAQMTVA